eukprot:1143156-Pelagomonas_calceolata.AAC.7
MRCSFCATGKGGFARNLQPHEIVDQVLTVQEAFGKRVSNVVFMVGARACVAALSGAIRAGNEGGVSALECEKHIRSMSIAYLPASLQGMGEPLLALPSVVQAYKLLNKQLGIGGRFITISTVGGCRRRMYLLLEQWMGVEKGWMLPVICMQRCCHRMGHMNEKESIRFSGMNELQDLIFGGTGILP